MLNESEKRTCEVKLGLPKIGLPKIGLPKIGLPKIDDIANPDACLIISRSSGKISRQNRKSLPRSKPAGSG